MDIEFVVEDDLPTVLGKLMQDQPEETAKVLLNSLLILLVQQGTSLLQLMQQLQGFLEDREVSIRKAAIKTLVEVLRRTRDLTCSIADMQECVRRLIPRVIDVPIAGQSINVLQQIVLAATEISPVCCSQLIALFNDPKFHPTSHRQQVRLCCYRMLIQLTKKCRETLCHSPLSHTNFIRTIMESTYEEKDPRNIGSVFRLYEWTCSNMSVESLTPFAGQLYESLEAYYPIDFIGDDQEGESTILEELSQSLDWCLTHPIFAEQCLHTLVEKMGSPPIKQFLPTLNLFILRNHTEIKFQPKLITLIRRVLQQEFLEDVDCHLPLIDCIDSLVQFAYRRTSWPAIPLDLSQFLTTVLSSALDERLLTTQAGFSLNLVRVPFDVIQVLAANFKAKQFVGYFIVSRFLREVDAIDAANETRVEILLGLVVAALNNNPRMLPDGLVNVQDITIQALRQRLELVYGYAATNQQQSLKVIVLKILMSLPHTPISREISESVLKMLSSSTVDVLLRKSLVDFLNAVQDPTLQLNLSNFVVGLAGSSITSDEDAQVLVYSLVWRKDFKLINELLCKQPPLVVDALLEQLTKLPVERAIDCLLSLSYQNLQLGTLRKFQSTLQQIHNKQPFEEESSMRITRRLEEALSRYSLAEIFVLCGWRSAIREIRMLPNELVARLTCSEQLFKDSANSLSFALFEEIAGLLPISSTAETNTCFTQVVNAGRIRRLGLSLILELKQQLQRQDHTCQALLNRVSQASKHDYPTLRQLLARHILPVLLSHAQHSSHQKQFFRLLKSIPLGELRTINERILRVILLQLKQLEGDFDLLHLCLDILVQFQEQLSDDKLESVLPVLLKQLSSKQLAPTVVLLNCLKLLHFMSSCTFALRNQKEVVTCLKPLLAHRKRKVRQAASASLNRWYNL